MLAYELATRPPTCVMMPPSRRRPNRTTDPLPRAQSPLLTRVPLPIVCPSWPRHARSSAGAALEGLCPLPLPGHRCCRRSRSARS